MALRQTPIYRSQWRAALVLGAQRGWVIMTGTVCAVFAVLGGTLLHLIGGVVAFVGVVGTLREMSRRDVQLLDVYMRQLKYKARYAARSTRWRGM